MEAPGGRLERAELGQYREVGMPALLPHLVTVSGQDAPGIAERLFAALGERRIEIRDVEQVRVHGRLLLCVEIAGLATSECATLRAAIADRLTGDAVNVTVDPLFEAEDAAEHDRFLVTALAPEIAAATLEGICGRIAGCDGNIERIVRLSAYPVHSYEFAVAGGDLDLLRRALADEAVRREVDIAVQVDGLHRRAKHLIVLDADSTLLQGEVIDLLAEACGCGAQVREVTEAAMAGEIDFEDALRRRVRLLAGLDQTALDRVRESLLLSPGARTLVRTLKRLGYETAVVSGGFTQVIAPLAAELGIDHLAANELEMAGGVLTGGLVGPIVDRVGKADALVRFAAAAGVPQSRTIAVGDGANDLDMLAAAGLGIAFNAKPLVRQAADTTINVPYLDAILFLLGISRDEVETADLLEQVGRR
ncbi:MAG: phosphoserine phosphatase SerB [Acidimicrobiales bacterium]